VKGLLQKGKLNPDPYRRGTVLQNKAIIMKRLILFSITLFLVCLAPESEPGMKTADRIFTNGRVWTGEMGQPLAEAIAVQGELIAPFHG
jgi:hypothetical protein